MPALACCVDAAAAVAPPPGYATFAGDSSFFSAIPTPQTHTSDVTTTSVAAVNSHWSTSHSASLYKIDRWGAPYFSVNSSGNICVRPHGAETLPHQEIDLLKIVKKASDPKSGGGLGLQLPLVVRLPDVLKNRVESLQSAFDFAIQANGYQARYQGVYPVKCNHDRFVVEDIVRFGSAFRFGLEAGSKPELLLAMSCLCKGNPDSLLICNGFKDAEYISLALVARKLALNSVIVLEQEEELDLVIELSNKVNVRPVIGVRAKLRTKHSGHFGSTSGEKGKFGLTTTQILRVVKRLEQAGMLDCLQLLHFHIGSQIPTTALLADGVGEAAQIYCELVRLGANMKVIDTGGGLGIDYDGSKAADSDISVAYGLEEYALAVVQAIRFVCDRKSVKHPVICTESGRAIVSHHSILIFEAFSSGGYDSPVMSQAGLQYLVDGFGEEAGADYRNLTAATMRGEYEACLLYADQLKQRCVEQFKEGSLGIEQLAAVDGLCDLVSKAIGASDPVLTYHVNLSVFTSIPDFWGIGQLFPIVPIHRLGQRPGVRGILSDLTCDSDGKIDKFIGGESSLPLHELEGNGGGVSGNGRYYLGMFLGGAYEEALGGVHNLFGGPSIVRVLQSDGPHSFAVTLAVPGPSCADVLRVMQHEPELMFETLKHRAEEFCRQDDHDCGRGDGSNDDHGVKNAALASSLAQSFHNMPYLVAASSCSLTAAINNNGFYYCNEDDYNAAVDTAAGDDEQQWSYCIA
ncbi:Orn_DAP_Arg_deC domain-containing protein/Orn_Arg_deC_N domain-containing protein [Cephalotus follicularis]|uniref:Arginine decarboxylase n=1 Tax=Cephalotus follicularis TaxID=3775 RepID=A0A1Q3BZC0_CEPFO|nr:Orn_DAP_Arg_deC domain-containing protein/Orn_Arg_deC_N domain-containing protein [Cephalotus follicularis]